MVKYLAVECFYGKNDYGFLFYQKHLSRHRGLAVHSLSHFMQLLESVTNEMRIKRALIIDQNNVLRDGEHRLAIALYHSLDVKIEKAYYDYPVRIVSLLDYQRLSMSFSDLQILIQTYQRLIT